MGRKKKIVPVVPPVNLYSFGDYNPTDTIGQILIQRIKKAGAFTPGVSVPPCVILWTDPERQWESIIDDLQQQLPELYVFGPYSPERRTGPAIWLKCIEARTIPVSHPENIIPIFYLPGVSLQQLRDGESCAKELQPLVEYLYRGATWHHPNGRDWTPFAFLSSEPGGLQFDMSKDENTKAALLRALPVLLGKKAENLSDNHIDSGFINHLLAPDFPREILQWMNNPKITKGEKGKEEWEAFLDQSEKEYGFHPEKDGKLRAAQLLTQRKDAWQKVWERFTEAPTNYPILIKTLHKVDPPEGVSDNELEPYPAYNRIKEKELSDALLGLKNKRRDEAVPVVLELEKTHGHRRDWVWSRVQQSQFACALEHLARLAQLTEKPLNAQTTRELGELYTQEGWKVDLELLDSLACCLTRDHEEPIKEVAHILYLDWLDRSARNFQEAIKREGNQIKPKLEPVTAIEGRLILFVDGLRFDIAQYLLKQLSYMGYNLDISWDWSPVPSITQTAKYYVSPINNLITGDVTCSELNPKIAETEHVITAQPFEELMKKNDIQVIDNLSNGDPNGKAWTESGTIDQAAHNEGWRISRRIHQEIQDLALRIDSLMKGGWQEVLVVTDHGWLMVPMSFNKSDLPKNLTDLKWGRCAVLKETSPTDFQLLPWFWNDMIKIASPPGANCFRNGMQYTHGGVSLQELVVPRILVKKDAYGSSDSKITNHRWVGLRCQIQISNPNRELKVDIRMRVADSDSSLIEGSTPREISLEGSISLPISDPDNEGKEGHIALLDKEGNIIHAISTTIGGRL